MFIIISIQQKKMSLPQSTSVTTKRQKSGRWTTAEADLFEELIDLYGKDWKKIQAHIKGRTLSQVRSHGQKFFDRVGPEKTQEYERKAKLLEAMEVLRVEKQFQDQEKERKRSTPHQQTVKTEEMRLEEQEQVVQSSKKQNGSAELINSNIKEQLNVSVEKQPEAIIQNSPNRSEATSLQRNEGFFTPIFWFGQSYLWNNMGAQAQNYTPGINYKMSP